MGVVIRRWVWLETIGVVSGCFPHITYISLLHLYLFFFAAASQGRIQGGGYGGSSPPPSRKWAGLQCAHAQRHVITIELYTLNRCFWRVFRAATDQGRI